MMNLATRPTGFGPTHPSRYPVASLFDAEEALGEAEVADLASRLLNVRTDAQRDHLLGAALIEGSGGALSRPVGAALGGLLKSLARPNLFRRAPAREALEAELEGLSGYELEFEAARRFVRLASEAARNASEDRAMGHPHLVARSALAAAADAYAPSLTPSLVPTAGTRAGPRMPAGRPIVMRGMTLPSTLVIEPFDYDPEMEYFLGGVAKSLGRAAAKAVKTAGRAADQVSRTASKAMKAVGSVPILGDVARAGVGAARLSLGPAAIAVDAGLRVARGENLGRALRSAAGGQIDAARSQLRLAEMVAPFVPGVGTGIAAALGAANALAAGRPITEAVLAAARGALPGGAVAQAAFDTALNLAKGKNLAEAAFAAARERLPGGPAARAAFDAAVALAKGKRLQDAAFAAAGRVLPPSPYAADALAFAKRVANGQNIQHAALSVAGQRAVRQIHNSARLVSREVEFEEELTWTRSNTTGGLRVAREMAGVDREFETDPMAPYRIQGGLYTPDQRRYEAQHPKGLILTASVIGREEKRLAMKGPSPINIGKELTNFENGKLARAIANFNAFTFYFDEILKAIGRLRDLLSAGAPEAPKLMSALQNHALRPTNDRSGDSAKNIAYDAWRKAQREYISASEAGRLNGGSVYDVADKAKKIVAARYDFWQAHGDLLRTLKAKLSAPEFEAISMSMSDVASIIFSGSMKAAATAGVSIGIDLILETRKNRREYDAQMKKFEEAIRTRKSLIQDELATYRSKGEAYWNLVENFRSLLEKRDTARKAARIAAGHFGRTLPPASESRAAKKAEVRMPAHVADAWRVLAIIGPVALASVENVIEEKAVVDRARFHYMKNRPVDRPSEDILAITNAYNQAISWKPVLNAGQLRIWVATNKAWDDRFNQFNV
jgi:hypothetical protein